MRDDPGSTACCWRHGGPFAFESGQRVTRNKAMKNTDAIFHPQAVMQELQKFQGCWRQTYAEMGGIGNPADEVGSQSRCTFADNTFVVYRADGDIVIEGTFAIDPTREPKTVDWTDTFGADAGKTLPAIYRLDGDELVFCVGNEGEQAPREFRTRPATEDVLRIHRREASAPLAKA